MEKLRCVIERVVFKNEENGYSVFQVSVLNDSGKVYDCETIVGTFFEVGVGTSLCVEGDWREDKRYGRQFAVETWVEELPATIRGLENYLGSGLIDGIGQKTARTIVKKFGLDTIDILDYNPNRLLEIQGIGKSRVEKIKRSWQKQKDIKEVMIFLQGYGVSATYAAKIYKEYGRDSIAYVEENPYRLADDIFGIGFKMADEVAAQMGYTKNDVRRCKAGVLYTLSCLSKDGHCYSDRAQLLKAAVDLLGADEEPICEGLESLITEGSIVLEDEAIYLPMYYFSECGVAERIGRLLESGSDNLNEDLLDIEAVEENSGIEYDEIQVDAIREAIRSKVMVLTGNPGTGKTTTLLGIIAAYESFNKEIVCAAPTGRAAKRMSEATGKDACTIHRLLEYYPNEGFTRNEANPLDGDVLIIDEASMIDISLMYSLMKAIPKKMRLILVGDIDQLPSVGAGNVLRDVIDSGVVPVVRLTRIFRQALTSRIVTNAHRVNRGEMPDISNGAEADFFFIERDDPELAAKEVVGIVSERIPKAYGYEAGDIQVLAPMTKGAAGTKSLNAALQEAINPEGECITSGSYKYREGDKVMQIKNNYDKGIFNGDIGVITYLDAEERIMDVQYDERTVSYEGSEFGEITLAYATTIHKSQGSEYPVVVMPILMSHFVMLQRNLIYTGITRAKKLCIIVGTKKALAYAVKNMVVLKRNTMLKERLRNRMEQKEEAA